MLQQGPPTGWHKNYSKAKPTVYHAIFKIGGPVALMNSLFAFINMSLGRLASLYGGHIGVLTLTTGGQLEGLSWNTAQGFSALSAFPFPKTLGLANYTEPTLPSAIPCSSPLQWVPSLCYSTTLVASGYSLLLYPMCSPTPQVHSTSHTSGGTAIQYARNYLPRVSSTEYAKASYPPHQYNDNCRIPLAFSVPLYKDITILWWIMASGTSVLKASPPSSAT